MAPALKTPYLASDARFKWEGLAGIHAVQTQKLHAMLTRNPSERDTVFRVSGTSDVFMSIANGKLQNVISEIGKSTNA